MKRFPFLEIYITWNGWIICLIVQAISSTIIKKISNWILGMSPLMVLSSDHFWFVCSSNNLLLKEEGALTCVALSSFYSAFNEQNMFAGENCSQFSFSVNGYRGTGFKANYFVFFFFLDKLCFPLQHSKNSYDQTKGFNHVWNDTVQVSWEINHISPFVCFDSIKRWWKHWHQRWI